MNYIISEDNYRHQKYKTQKNLKNINWDEVDCLIFHESSDGELETIMEISKAKDKISKIIYVNKDIHPLYYSIFKGLDADIYDDSSMLSDEDTIDFLVENYNETGMTVKSATVDVETISEFAKTISKENIESLEKLVKNHHWLKTLKKSVSNIENSLVRVDESNLNMLEIFNKTAEVVDELQEQSEKLQEEVVKISEYAHSIEEKNSNGASNTTFYFSTYQVPNTLPNVMYIRVYSPCRFLISFIKAYQHYLKITKQIDSRLLLAVPKLKQFMAKYDFLPRLDVDTVNSINVDELGEMMVTFEPKPIVLNGFFDIKTDMHIVIDMMFGDNLLAGPKVIPINAVNSLSDIKRFQLNPKKTIVTLSGTTSNIVIPHMKEYTHAKTESAKKTLYYNFARENKTGAYAKLDSLLSI